MANEPYGSIMRGGVCYGGVGDPAVINQVSDNIAPKQATNTASELIPAGKYFVNSDGKLCQCDVQIASGGTIIVGTNCHLIPDGGINELNDKIGGSALNYRVLYQGTNLTSGSTYNFTNVMSSSAKFVSAHMHIPNVGQTDFIIIPASIIRTTQVRKLLDSPDYSNSTYSYAAFLSIGTSFVEIGYFGSGGAGILSNATLHIWEWY